MAGPGDEPDPRPPGGDLSELLGALTLDQARALVEALHTQELLAEAEQAAHGIRHLTVQHGDLETADDVRRHEQLSEWVWARRDRARICARGTNDTTTWVIEGADAEQLLAGLELLAHDLNPGWWRIRRAGR